MKKIIIIGLIAILFASCTTTKHVGESTTTQTEKYFPRTFDEAEAYLDSIFSTPIVVTKKDTTIKFTQNF